MLATLLAATASGCAVDTPTGPPHVNLSLIAPTDGATVFVRRIVVFGHVDPSQAQVLVAGRRATVHKGTFRVLMRLPRSVNHIGILATASGFRSATLATTVRFSRSRSISPPATASRSGSPHLRLPKDFAARAVQICSSADQQIEASRASLPPGTASLFRQIVAIRRGMNRQLIGLMSPAAGLPAVQRFVKDLHAMAGFDAAILNAVVQGRSDLQAQLAQRFLARIPQWWADAGRLGIPSCGGTWHQL